MRVLYVSVHFVREALITLCFGLSFQERWYSQRPWNIQRFILEQRTAVVTAMEERHGASLQKKRQAYFLPRKIISPCIVNYSL